MIICVGIFVKICSENKFLTTVVDDEDGGDNDNTFLMQFWLLDKEWFEHP